MQFGVLQHLSWVSVFDRKILSRGSNQVDIIAAPPFTHVTRKPRLGYVWVRKNSVGEEETSWQK